MKNIDETIKHLENLYNESNKQVADIRKEREQINPNDDFWHTLTIDICYHLGKCTAYNQAISALYDLKIESLKTITQ